jgi:hypothetical protein
MLSDRTLTSVLEEEGREVKVGDQVSRHEDKLATKHA